MRFVRNAFVFFLLVVFASGCVTRGEYDQQKQQTEMQQERADVLEDDVDYLLDQLAALEEGKELSDQTVNRLEATVEDLTERIDQLEESRASLRTAKNKEIKDLKTKLDSLNKERDALQQKLNKSRKRNEKLTGTVSDLEEELSESEQGRTELNRKLSDLQEANDSLRNELESLRDERERLRKSREVTVLDESIQFKSASAELTERNKRTLDGMVDRLRNSGNQRIVVVGHTDTVPISSAPFSSNWDLSAQRASAVVEYLTGTTSLDPSRFAVKGRGPYELVNTPDRTPKDQQLDRRVQIQLISR